MAITGIPATLTDAGAAAFGTYEAGEELDPVDVEIVGPRRAPSRVAAATGAELPGRRR